MSTSVTPETEARYDVTTISPKPETIILRIESYLKTYAVFTDPRYALPLAVWTAMTHAWTEAFDAVPYLCLTASTSGAGKTMVSDLLSFVSAKPKQVPRITQASLSRLTGEEQSTLFFDESEMFNSESSSFREVLNAGYRRGQSDTKMDGKKIVESATFGPKCFQLIGDPCETLRSRCIVINMRRATAREQEMNCVQDYDYSKAKLRGESLKDDLVQVIAARLTEIGGLYHDAFPMPPFVHPRDREIWKPLFALCRVLCPDRLRELGSCAIDLAAAKTAPRRKANELAEAEAAERDRAYAERLLVDMAKVIGDKAFMPSGDVVVALRGLETSPWRMFRGTGVTQDREGEMLVASLLSRFGFQPKVGPGGKKRGYRRMVILRAIDAAGLKPEPVIESDEQLLEGLPVAREA
jgi:Protein of unknown function (DUF3631)